MRIVKILKKSKLNKFRHELMGTIHIYRSRRKYLKEPANFNVEQSITQSKSSNFTKYFMNVEKAKMEITKQINPNHIGKNVPNTVRADSHGIEWVKFLLENGLNETSSVLDYGCGSLRLGKSVIEFLNKAQYTGVDIDDYFYKMGIENYLSDNVLKNKKPEFYVIDDVAFKQNMDLRKFDFIYSTWVVMHVPPEELKNYFLKVTKFMHEKSLFFFDIQPALFTIQKNSLTWGYSYQKINSILRACGAKAEVAGGLIKVYLNKR